MESVFGMRIYRTMSKEELQKTSDNCLNFDKCRNKWFTPSFGFLFRKLRKRNKYQYAMAIETDYCHFRRLNNKELMISCNFPFKIIWIKDLNKLLQ